MWGPNKSTCNLKTNISFRSSLTMRTRKQAGCPSLHPETGSLCMWKHSWKTSTSTSGQVSVSFKLNEMLGDCMNKAGSFPWQGYRVIGHCYFQGCFFLTFQASLLSRSGDNQELLNQESTRVLGNLFCCTWTCFRGTLTQCSYFVYLFYVLFNIFAYRAILHIRMGFLSRETHMQNAGNPRTGVPIQCFWHVQPEGHQVCSWGGYSPSPRALLASQHPAGSLPACRYFG